MSKDIKTVNIEFYEINNEDCLKFTFINKLSKKDALDGIKDWEEIFASVEDGEKTTIVWDSLKMSGFENSARHYWQKAIKKLKDKIGTIWLITNSKTIKAGAKLMSIFTSFEIKVVKSEKDII